eukprot:gene14889-17601_t
MFDFGMYGMIPAMYSRKAKGSTKKRKPKKENWFERLTVDQMKDLLKASRQTVSGTKAELVARLMANENTSSYGAEARAGTISRVTLEWVGHQEGKTLDDIKAECRNKGLQVSGTKYDLVLRLLQATHGVGTPKRAAVEVSSTGAPIVDASGAPVPKKRKASTKTPDMDKLSERIKKKIFQDSSKWSNQKFKDHASDVFSACANIIQKEAFDKGFVERKDLTALDICEAVFEPIVSNESRLSGQGYDLVKEVIRAVGSQMSLETIAVHREWINEVRGSLSAYGVDSFELDDELNMFEAPLLEQEDEDLSEEGNPCRQLEVQ